MTEIVIKGDGTSPSTAECAGSCPKCVAQAAGEEMAFAFLLALMPVVSLTLFGQAGLL